MYENIINHILGIENNEIVLKGLFDEWNNMMPFLFGLDSSLSSDKKKLFSLTIKEFYEISNTTEGIKNILKVTTKSVICQI